MGPRQILIGMLASATLALAQIEPSPESPLSPKEDALEEILSERASKEALEKAVTNARELGIPEQAILEARFLFHVDRAEDAEIAALLPEFIKRVDEFKLSESEIFGAEDDWLAVVQYVHAIAAIEKGDQAGFKKHITEAFWLSPRQGAVFAPHIDRIRLMDAMKAIRVDMGRPYLNVMEANPVSIGEVLGKRKGVLLHFWSPWSRECEATLSDFFLTAEHLVEKDVGVVSILPETSLKVMADAKAMLKTTEKKVPGTWIVDLKKSPLSNKLRVQSVPTVVLISAEGEVLYNGHPTNEEFWKALEGLNPEIQRPELREDR